MVKSIAVFGITGTFGSIIAENLIKHSFRLLLITDEKEECSSLLHDFPDAEIQLVDCPAESGWEADIVVLDASVNDQLQLISSIREFVTQKIVIWVSDMNRTDLQEGILNIKSRLPYSKLIELKLFKNESGQFRYSILGEDKDALHESDSILSQIGFLKAPIDLLITN